MIVCLSSAEVRPAAGLVLIETLTVETTTELLHQAMHRQKIGGVPYSANDTPSRIKG